MCRCNTRVPYYVTSAVSPPKRLLVLMNARLLGAVIPVQREKANCKVMTALIYKEYSDVSKSQIFTSDRQGKNVGVHSIDDFPSILGPRDSSSDKARKDIVSEWNIREGIPRDRNILAEHEHK